MCNPHASSPPPHTGDGVWAGPCSHKQRCHWATPPHPTCAPWSKSWWLCSLSKQDLFSLTSKDLRTMWHPLLALMCHLFSSKSLASLYTWHGTVPSAPPFLETSSLPVACVHHCSSHHASCPHSRQLQIWWMPSIFYSSISAPNLASTPSSPHFS